VGITKGGQQSGEMNEASHSKIGRRLRSSRRTTMKESANSRLSKGIFRAAIALVAIGIAAAPSVQAKPHTKGVAGNPANVVAHVELSGSPVTAVSACTGVPIAPHATGAVLAIKFSAAA